MKRALRPLVDNGDGTISIPLSRGLWALIDADCEQLPAIRAVNWCALPGPKTWYAVRNLPRAGGGKTQQRLHKLILPGHLEVDHEDGNGLNNCRSNLRPCTSAQNAQNRSLRSDSGTGHKGVIFEAVSKKFRAEIQHSGIRKRLGRFPTAELAHAAYCRAAAELHGAFARTK